MGEGGEGFEAEVMGGRGVEGSCRLVVERLGVKLLAEVRGKSE